MNVYRDRQWTWGKSEVDRYYIERAEAKIRRKASRGPGFAKVRFL